jgi:maltooligosyltrehalose trehalohydrolase
MQLILSGLGPEGDRRIVDMQSEPRGYFTHVEPECATGQRYSFRLEGTRERPDPASRWQPDGVHRPSAFVPLERFEWSDAGWSGLCREDLIIYELHVGTFTRAGTFDEACERLVELRELGITAVELMPVGQFAGDRGWGYDGVYPYAAQESYGGPRGLQRFVDACHRAGLAVLLDVVYNHLGPEGNYLAEFGPYFTDRYHTPWGAAVNFDGAGSDAVRAFILDNVRQWIRDYHFDGLRLDAVHAICDFSPRHILREIKEAADEEAWRFGRPGHVIAESNLNDVRLLDGMERGGYGLSAQWSDDFHHAVHVLLTGEREMYYADFGQPEQLVKALNETFVYDGCYSPFRGRRHGAPAGRHPGSRFVISIQNHDQVGNRARGNRFGTLLNPAQQRLAAGLMLVAPYLPLIFMGEEYGERHPFPFFCSFPDPDIAQAARRGRREEFAEAGWGDDVPDPQAESTFESAKLSWDFSEGTCRAGLRRLYSALLTLRRTQLRLSDFPERTARFVTMEESPTAVLRLTRHAVCNQPAAELIAFFNLTDQPRDVPDEERPKAALIMSSESSCYGGRRTAEDPRQVLLPFEFQIYGPDTTRTP